jgi:hypothetical protein
MCLSICPPIHLSTHLFIYPFIYLFIYPFISSSIHLSTHLFILSFIYLFIHSPIYLFIHLIISSLHPSHPSHPSYPLPSPIHRIYRIHLIHLSTSSIYLPAYLPSYPAIYQSLYLFYISISRHRYRYIDVSTNRFAPPPPSFTPHQAALVGGTRRADRMADAVLSPLSVCSSPTRPLLSICLPFCSSSLRPICPSVHPPFGPSVRPPFGPFSRSPSVFCAVVTFLRLPFCSAVFLFIFRPFCWFVLPTPDSHSVLRFFCPSVRPSVRLPFCPSVRQSISPSARLLPSYCFLPFLPSVPPLLG